MKKEVKKSKKSLEKETKSVKDKISKDKKIINKNTAPVRTKIIINSKNMTKKQVLEKAEEKLGRVLNKVKEKDIVHIAKDLGLDKNDIEVIKKLKEKGIEVSFPNLKYAQPKYSNVSELLKYVESDKPQEGGVKLVIMNFND